DARRADVRADIYSLGCTLYCLLTGRPPFVERTAMQTILAHLHKEPVPLHEVRADVPPELSAVVARMLAKDPANRYQTRGEVAEALAAATVGLAGSNKEERREPHSRLRRRVAALAVAAGVLWLGMILTVILLLSTKDGIIEIELSDPAARAEVKVDGGAVE